MIAAPESKQAYTVAQFCRQFGVSRSTFYRMIRDGEIRTKKLGARTLVRAEDAKEWLDSLPDGVA